MDKIVNQIVNRVVTKTSSFASKPLIFEPSTLARLTDGSCTCSLGDTSVLVTAVSHDAKPTFGGFFPLTVDYRHKSAAFGRISTRFNRRDAAASEKEILASRIIDRSLRPLFPKGLMAETQIVCNMLAMDGHHDPEVVAINGASATLSLSDIPWNGPVGAVRMGLIGDKQIANPTRRELENSIIDLVLTTNRSGNVIMMEAGTKEPLDLKSFNKVLKTGISECQSIAQTIDDFARTIGKPKRKVELAVVPDEYIEHAISHMEPGMKEIFTDYSLDKMSRDLAWRAKRDEYLESARASFPDIDPSLLNEAASVAAHKIFRATIRETKKRVDGRKFTQLRPISSKIDLHKPLHGSAIFQRGQTQVFCSTTFDSPDLMLRPDTFSMLSGGERDKNFMLHYEFPQFATHDIGRVSSIPNRREIGHGALAEKAIRPVLPEFEDMTIRLSCEVLESNGSSSMASVCAGSLSLMDAGVKIKEHVAGVAIGLLTFRAQDNESSHEDEQILVLTDINGLEDYAGDMDFKIAGTRNALTALQLDVKLPDGISLSTIKRALAASTSAKSHIIDLMEETIKEPRSERKENHPVMKTISIPAHKVPRFMGMFRRKLLADVGVRVTHLAVQPAGEDDVSTLKGDEKFLVFAPNKDAMAEAEEFIENVLRDPAPELELQFNGIYTATIEEIRDNGVMVTLYPNMRPALLHLSQLDTRAVVHPSALDLKVGQQIQVKYFGRDPATGHMRLSRKTLLMSTTPKVPRSRTN